MQITKFGQSCLLIEKGDSRIVIDPGSFFAAKHNIRELGKVGAVLVTHEHGDHMDKATIDALRQAGAQIYANQSAAKQIGEPVRVVKDGDSLDAAGFQVTARDLPHCDLLDQSEPPQNTGYIIDGSFFHPGDGIKAEGLQVDNLAVAIAGPSISMFDAARFTEALGAKKVIPIHYDYFLEDPRIFKNAFKGAEVIVLGDGESVEL